jgi:murein DD-endopeptidase MepM/ murein hydrolase activator NlpD
MLACLALCWLGAPSLWARDVVRHLLADGFDFPVGPPDAKGYYKYRGYTPNGHLGEDWNGVGGGNTDLGDPIYSIAHGVVVYSDDRGGGWGNCIIVRHAYRDSSGKIRYVDSQYGHLLKRLVKLHDRVRKGQKIGTLGSNRGMYAAHLHFEMRKELRLGMDRTQWPRDNTCYYHPTNFINQHRTLRSSSKLYPIPVNTFAGQGRLGKDPRLKNLEVPLGKDDLKPLEEKGSKEKNSILKRILQRLGRDEEEDGKDEDALRKMRERLDG